MRIADIIAMTALVVTILVAVLIGANFQSAITALNLTGEAATTAQSVFSNMWTGLMLASIGIIVAAAVGIIALVLGALGRVGGGA